MCEYLNLYILEARNADDPQHAYAFIRSPMSDQGLGDGHDANFRTMIHAVHRRAYDCLGVAAIAREEDYFHYHHMSDQWADERGGGPLGPRDDGDPLPVPFKGDGVERIPIGGRYGGSGNYGKDTMSSLMGLIGSSGGFDSPYPYSEYRGEGYGAPSAYGKYGGLVSYSGYRGGRHRGPSPYGGYGGGSF